MSDGGSAPRALSPRQREIVAQALPLAMRLWGHFLRETRSNYLADDLRSAAVQALHEAALAYDPARGVPFDAFAWRRIDGALTDALKQESKHWRAAREEGYDAADALEDESNLLVDTEAETNVQLDGMGEELATAAVLGLLGRAVRASGEEGERLRATHEPLLRAAESALSRLTEQERGVLVSHHFEERTWQEIGALLGCSERTAKRRGAEARKRFVAALRAERERAQGSMSVSGHAGAEGATPG